MKEKVQRTALKKRKDIATISSVHLSIKFLAGTNMERIGEVAIRYQFGSGKEL